MTIKSLEATSGPVVGSSQWVEVVEFASHGIGAGDRVVIISRLSRSLLVIPPISGFDEIFEVQQNEGEYKVIIERGVVIAQRTLSSGVAIYTVAVAGVIFQLPRGALHDESTAAAPQELAASSGTTSSEIKQGIDGGNWWVSTASGESMVAETALKVILDEREQVSNNRSERFRVVKKGTGRDIETSNALVANHFYAIACQGDDGAMYFEVMRVNLLISAPTGKTAKYLDVTTFEDEGEELPPEYAR